MEVPYLLQPPVSDADLELAFEFLLEQRPADEAANLRRAFRGRDLPTINRLLALYGAERKPVERSPSGKSSYRLGQQGSASKGPDAADLRKIEFAVTDGLRKSLGPRWFETDVDRENLISEAMKIWLERYGWFQAPSPDMVKEVVNRVRNASPELRKVFESPDFEKLRSSFEDPLVAERERSETKNLLEVFSEYLHSLEHGSPSDQFRRMILMLHMGSRMAPGQPPALVGEVAYNNLLRFHTGSTAQAVCPTCKSISKYVRAVGLTPERTVVIINNCMADITRQVRV